MKGKICKKKNVNRYLSQSLFFFIDRPRARYMFSKQLSFYSKVLALPSFIWKQLAGESVAWMKDYATIDASEV